MKVSKAEAKYRPATDQRSCGNCRFMNRDGSCDKVTGQVDRRHVSKFWAKGRGG